jgi:hypothetical protein
MPVLIMSPFSHDNLVYEIWSNYYFFVIWLVFFMQRKIEKEIITNSGKRLAFYVSNYPAKKVLHFTV